MTQIPRTAEPRLTLGRLAAGAVAGLSGTMPFVFLTLGSFVVTAAPPPGALDTTFAALPPLASPLATLFLTMLEGILLGVVFSLLVRPIGLARTTLIGLGVGLALWALGVFAIHPLRVGSAAGWGAATWVSLVSHAVYGAVLGLVYYLFHHAEVRESRDAQSARWRAFGATEERVERPRRARGRIGR